MSTPDFDKKQADADQMFDFLDEDAANTPERPQRRRVRKELVMPIIRKPVPISESGPARVGSVPDASAIEDDFDFLGEKPSQRQKQPHQFDNDWNEGIHTEYAEKEPKLVRNLLLLLVSLAVLGGGTFAYKYFIEPGINDNSLAGTGDITQTFDRDTNVDTVVEPLSTNTATDNLDLAAQDTETLVTANPVKPLSQRFSEQLQSLEAMLDAGELDSAETAIADMDRSVYGYGAPEFTEIENRIEQIRAGTASVLPGSETIAEAEQSAEAARIEQVAREQAEAEAARLAETARAEQAAKEAEAARLRAEEAQRQVEEARLALEQRAAEAEAEAARLVEEARLQKEAEQAEAERAAQAAREAEAERAAQAAREAEAERAAQAAREAEAERAAQAAREAEAQRAAQAAAAALAAEQQSAADKSLALAKAKAEERLERERLARIETDRRIAERARLNQERAKAAEFARQQAQARELERQRAADAQAKLEITPKQENFAITDEDFNFVGSKFVELKAAIENRDITNVIALTQRSGKRVQQMLQLFENNAGIKARIINVASRNADGVIVGQLTIQKLIKKSGAEVDAPSNLSSITLTSKRGPSGWSTIAW